MEQGVSGLRSAYECSLSLDRAEKLRRTGPGQRAGSHLTNQTPHTGGKRFRVLSLKAQDLAETHTIHVFTSDRQSFFFRHAVFRRIACEFTRPPAGVRSLEALVPREGANHLENRHRG